MIYMTNNRLNYLRPAILLPSSTSLGPKIYTRTGDQGICMEFQGAMIRCEILMMSRILTWGGGGTLGISGWVCATRTLEPLAYTRASFSWTLLPYTRVNSPNHSYPRVAVVQKLRSLAQSKAKPKQSLILLTFFL